MDVDVAIRMEALIADAILEVVGEAEDAEAQGVMWQCTVMTGISLLVPWISVCLLFLATLKLHHRCSLQRQA